MPLTGFCVLTIAAILAAAPPEKGSRARDLGIVIGRYAPGHHNAITDVAGIRVGQITIIEGRGRLVPGKGPVRTGVTVIVPHNGDIWQEKVAAGSFVLNGNGEATGLMWLQESGIIETPIALTNTLSVGMVQRALVEWMLQRHPDIGITDDTLTPIVFECDDGFLNDIRGPHVQEKHVFEALKKASSGPVQEGSVGAGTGMTAYEFKAGIGTASRLVPVDQSTYTIGVLVLANHGERHTFRVQGIPVGNMITDRKPKVFSDGSIVIVVATNAPMESRQLSRLAKRVALGYAKTGGVSHHGSGDIVIAFSTANKIPHYPKKALTEWTILSDFFLDDLFEAVADATEEAILNALMAGRTMEGRDGNTAYGLPIDELKQLLIQKGIERGR